MTKKRFFPALVLSLTPLSAFAESGAYAVKFYPGDYGTIKTDEPRTLDFSGVRGFLVTNVYIVQRSAA